MSRVAPPPAGDGKTHRVQYFERYRLEYYPDNPDPYKVQLGLLGHVAGDRRTSWMRR